MVEIDITRQLITEDNFVNWINDQGGIAFTRKLSTIDLSKLSQYPTNTLVGLTGYTHIITHFFSNIINKFNNKIILITLETDAFDMRQEYLEHPLLSHWFTWNKQFDHPKFTCIPIGLNQDRHLDSLKKFLTCPRKTRNKFFAVNLSVSTNVNRVGLVELAKTKWYTFCTHIDNIPFLQTYYQRSYTDKQLRIDVTNPQCYTILSEYKFILSPPGAGLDCHRTWEALYSGTIPIIISSSINEIFKDLPVVIVSSWDIITKDFLETKYKEVLYKLVNNEYNFEKLYFDYWKDLINNKIKEIS